MNGEIVLIKKIVNENELVLGYEAVIEFNERPSLKLGNCEVKNEIKIRKEKGNKEEMY